MDINTKIRSIIDPVLAEQSVNLYDLEFNGGVLQITLDRPGGIDIDVIGSVSRTISRLLDEHDPIPGTFTLEVSSPGLERRLRTPEHFVSAVGESVSVKTRAGVDGDRRFKAVVSAANSDEVTFTPMGSGEPRVLTYDQLERVRTVFEWGPAPKPGQSASSPSAKKKASKP